MTEQQVQIRVRFAPSPTGHLHVGGARTALYNWLYARKTGGVFVLRIEDTDAQRSTAESYEGIVRGMRWLGLDWDEGPDCGGEYGPYVQSARGVLYHSDAGRLVDEGKAYYCFCTAHRLEALKFEQRESRDQIRYDGHCRDLDTDEVARRLAAGEPHVIRFRMPEGGEVRFDDVVRGEFTIANEELDDFVLIKSDGLPTYNFAVVVDDARMRISHVIRGDDHLSNTPRQVHLYAALGYPLPKFAHLPMILGGDRTRLSKRHGAVSVDFYRENHYLPDAMVNYLALLGWSFDDRQELFSRPALIEKFSLKRVSKNPAMFDNDKMEYINAEHFKRLDLLRKTQLVHELLREQGYLPGDFEVDFTRPVDLKLVPGTQPVAAGESQEGGTPSKQFHRLAMIVQIMGNRLKLLRDAPSQIGYFFKDEFPVDRDAFERHVRGAGGARRLARLADALEGLRYFERGAVEETVRAFADELGIEAGELIHPCRVALTGGTVSPDIFWVIVLLGKAKTVERLRGASARAGG
ncbi:MAG: glutamate--tRNA ligase [Candidatus Krumholzibacteria bacterium]|nr:glutamate--tRNA ligase [Candidatus Krumholzibacteria bacterium]